MGKKKLRSWFLNPTFDLGVLEARLDSIEFCRQHFSAEDVRVLQRCFERCHDIEHIVRQLQDVRARTDDWKRLRNTLDAAHKIVILCKTVTGA